MIKFSVLCSILLIGAIASAQDYNQRSINIPPTLPTALKKSSLQTGWKSDLSFVAGNSLHNLLKSGAEKRLRLDAKIDEVYQAATGTYAPQYKTIFQYNANGYSSNMEDFEWDTAKSDWVVVTKNEFYYNKNGFLNRRVDSDYKSNSGEWVPSVKLDYGLDTLSRNGLINQFTYSSNTYTYVATKIFTFDNRDKPATAISYMENSDIGTWELSAKDNYTYNNAGELIRKRISFWNSSTGKWSPFWDMGFEYDVSGNVGVVTINSWKTSTLEFVPKIKQVFEYDLGQLFDNIMSPQSDLLIGEPVNNFVNKPLRSVNYKFLNNQWSVDGRTTYVYSGLTSGLNNTGQSSGISIYPNPTDGMVKIELKDANETGVVRLFDLAGKHLISKEFTGTVDLSIETLQGSVFIYTVQSKDQIYSGKIVLTH